MYLYACTCTYTCQNIRKTKKTVVLTSERWLSWFWLLCQRIFWEFLDSHVLWQVKGVHSMRSSEVIWGEAKHSTKPHNNIFQLFNKLMTATASFLCKNAASRTKSTTPVIKTSQNYIPTATSPQQGDIWTDRREPKLLPLSPWCTGWCLYHQCADVQLMKTRG